MIKSEIIQLFRLMEPEGFYHSILEKYKKASIVTMKAFQNPEDNLKAFSKLLLPKRLFGQVWARLYI